MNKFVQNRANVSKNGPSEKSISAQIVTELILLLYMLLK